MARQARSETTRQKILDAALALFDEIGYHATAMGDIIERAQMTKGALYYHFDSKEAVAAAIIEIGTAKLLSTFLAVCQSSAPAIENLIHSTFVVVDNMAGDKVARGAGRLRHALGEFSEAAATSNRDWSSAMSAQLARVRTEGDLREDVDPNDAAETIVAAIIGSTLMSAESSYGADLPARLLRMWGVLLPAIVPEHSLPYFREFLERETLRRNELSLSQQ